MTPREWFQLIDNLLVILMMVIAAAFLLFVMVRGG